VGVARLHFQSIIFDIQLVLISTVIRRSLYCPCFTVDHRYVTNLSALFVNGTGWDTNNNTVADAAEVDAFLFDIGANALVTATATARAGQPRGSSWSQLLNTVYVTGAPTTPTAAPTPAPTAAPHTTQTITSTTTTSTVKCNVGTVGEYAVAQLQSPHQPLRAKLAELIGVWNGLVVASKPVAHLADLSAPNSTTCYGYAEPMSVNYYCLHFKKSLRDIAA
jgi:hypothetical protein